MREIIIQHTALAGRTIALTGLPTGLTKDNVLGIINKTTGNVLYTPLAIANISSVEESQQTAGSYTITLASTVTSLAANDKVFVKLYESTELAKQSTLTAIKELLAGDDAPEELPEGVGDRLLLLLQHFGIAGSYEAEAKGGERTSNTVIDECKVLFQDAFNGLLPTGFTMPNSVTVDNLTYTGTTNS